MQLEGQVALITGAGSGIGKGAVLEMAAASVGIVAPGRTESQLCKIVAEIEAAGGEAIVVLAGISQPDQMQQAVEQVGARWGRISRDRVTTDNGRPTMGRSYQ